MAALLTPSPLLQTLLRWTLVTSSGPLLLSHSASALRYTLPAASAAIPVKTPYLTLFPSLKDGATTYDSGVGQGSKDLHLEVSDDEEIEGAKRKREATTLRNTDKYSLWFRGTKSRIEGAKK